MAKSNSAVSLGVSALIVIVIILIVGFGLFLNSTFDTLATKSTISVTTSSNTSGPHAVTPYCCVDANLTISTPCSTITNGNYPPDLILQNQIENDSDFIAAEQGLNYYATGPPACGNNFISGSETIYFYFAHTTDELYTSNCGGIYNITDYLTVKVPLTQTGYDMTAIEIAPTNSSQLTTTCTTNIQQTSTAQVNETSQITQTTSTINNTQSVSAYSAACLLEVPQNAVFGHYYNSTSQGTLVTYSNGTTSLFPLGICPVPVPPQNFEVDSTIESIPNFIAAENGSTYLATNDCNCSSFGGGIRNSSGNYVVLNFILYGNQKIYPCGPNSYWTLEQLGVIQVTIPVNSSGSVEYSNAQFQSEPGMNFFSCTTQLTSISTQTQTTTTTTTNS